MSTDVTNTVDSRIARDNAVRVMLMNRKQRRAIKVANGTAKIPGLNKPYVKPVIDTKH